VNFKEYFKLDEGKNYDFQVGKEYVGAFIQAFNPGRTHEHFSGYSVNKLNDIINFYKQNKNFGYNTLIFRNTFKSAKWRHKDELIPEVLITTESGYYRGGRGEQGKKPTDQIFRELRKQDFDMRAAGTYMSDKTKNQTFELVYKGTKYDLDKDTEQAWGGIINEL
jgi:hypothetical protein